MTDAIDLLPIATTVLAAVFAARLLRHWRRTRGARHLLWWTIGVTTFGLATLAESLVLIAGWEPWLFRTWYVAGALLGGAPLAQGTVYLVHRRKTADRLAIALVAYATIAAALVILTPIEPLSSDPEALSGRVMSWAWVRALTPAINLYAVAYLVGGAVWSAIRLRQRAEGSSRRVLGNGLIALGAIAPAVGGAFNRFGRSEVLLVANLAGLALIYAGYRAITGDAATGRGTSTGAR